MSRGGVVDYANAGFITQGEADAEAEAAATPKPRAGEHSELERLRCWNHRVSVCKEHVAAIVDGPCVICECDLLRERERELVEALKWIDEIASKEYEQDPKLRANGARTLKRLSDHAHSTLAKHGR